MATDYEKFRQKVDDLQAQIDNRPKFTYDADQDAIYQTLKDEHISGGRRAMEDTMGQASGLTGGYGSTYSQSAGNQSYNEFMTKLNAQVPVLAQQARAAYDAETDDLYRRLSVATADADAEYQRGRDELADARYQDELEYSRGRDALADQRYQDNLEYSRGRDAIADARYQDELDRDRENLEYNRSRTEQSDARDYAFMLIKMGIMPTAEDLQKAGLDSATVQKMVNYYNGLIMGSGSGSSSGSGSRSGSSSGGRSGSGSNSGDGSTSLSEEDQYRQALYAAAQAGDPAAGYNAVVSSSNSSLTTKQKQDLADLFEYLFDNKNKTGSGASGNTKNRPERAMAVQ